MIGSEKRVLAECGSTNDEAAAWARAGAPHGAIVIADAQTKGRGRLGRVWHSPPRAALYFSAILRPALSPMKVPPLTLAAGVALAETVARFDVRPTLKWPNDVLVEGKKLAGILTESATQGGKLEHVIVGIGVNLHVEEFPAGLNATSLHRCLAQAGFAGHEVAREEFVEVLCERLESAYERFLGGEIASAWKSFADCWGKTLKLSSGEEGVAEDLENDGALRLRTPKGIVRVLAGEIL